MMDLYLRCSAPWQLAAMATLLTCACERVDDIGVIRGSSCAAGPAPSADFVEGPLTRFVEQATCYYDCYAQTSIPCHNCSPPDHEERLVTCDYDYSHFQNGGGERGECVYFRVGDACDLGSSSNSDNPETSIPCPQMQSYEVSPRCCTGCRWYHWSAYTCSCSYQGPASGPNNQPAFYLRTVNMPASTGYCGVGPLELYSNIINPGCEDVCAAQNVPQDAELVSATAIGGGGVAGERCPCLGQCDDGTVTDDTGGSDPEIDEGAGDSA